jgi:hypothetical protein
MLPAERAPRSACSQTMFVNLSPAMRQDIIQAIRTATASHRIVQISQLADEVRRRHLDENVALEDIEEMLVGYAQVFSVMMEFDSTAVMTTPLSQPNLS